MESPFWVTSVIKSKVTVVKASDGIQGGMSDNSPDFSPLDGVIFPNLQNEMSTNTMELLSTYDCNCTAIAVMKDECSRLAKSSKYKKMAVNAINHLETVYRECY